MKIYVDVSLAGDDHAVVRRIRLEGTTEEGAFDGSTRLIEGAVKHFAWDVLIERDRLG